MSQFSNNIPNRIKQPSLCCIHCGKSYKKRTNMEKHSVVCELLQLSKKKTTATKEEDEELVPLPSQQKMFQMLIELGQKYNKLEEKVEEINKWVVKKKKKINVIEWLNSNVVPSLVFDKLIDIIKIDDSDVEYLMENSFLDTMNLVLSRFVYFKEGESDFMPLFAFVQKVNIFYAFVEDGGWMELSKDKLSLFLMRVQMKISKAFHEWKKQRANQIRDDESFAILCDKTLIKIMGNEFKQDSTFGKMRAVMYNKMKTDMKAMVEYEFEF